MKQEEAHQMLSCFIMFSKTASEVWVFHHMRPGPCHLKVTGLKSHWEKTSAAAAFILPVWRDRCLASSSNRMPGSWSRDVVSANQSAGVCCQASQGGGDRQSPDQEYIRLSLLRSHTAHVTMKGKSVSFHLPGSRKLTKIVWWQEKWEAVEEKQKPECVMCQESWSLLSNLSTQTVKLTNYLEQTNWLILSEDYYSHKCFMTTRKIWVLNNVTFSQFV